MGTEADGGRTQRATDALAFMHSGGGGSGPVLLASGENEPTRGRGPGPLVGLVAAVLVAAIGISVVLLAANGATDQTPSITEPTAQAGADPEPLTEAEAIAEFERLSAGYFRTAAEGDVDSLTDFVSPSGPAYARAHESISELIEAGVTDKSTVRFKSIEIGDLEVERIEVVTLEVHRPCFIDDAGANVTAGPPLIHREGVWTLVLDPDGWLIHDVKLESEEGFASRNSDCP